MPNPESVSTWIDQLRSGDDNATGHIWARYYERVLRFAARRLKGTARGAEDEEDVVSQAFLSFFRRAQDQQFPDMVDRDDLWRVLLSITRRKAIDQVRRQQRQKRGGAELEQAESVSLDQLVADKLGPIQSLIDLELVEHYLQSLEDAGLEEIAKCKLDGHTNVEIAARIQRSVPTVERRLRLIRRKWEQHAQ
ncbi:MAG: sigma-70 family RNA polymerase sigma factor [Pirellulaceae bacterium]|jgi:RNA polymerase sigma factor (sigma-70 family)|nr:sigma-70 family RNA polymerase sigma factor [Pirellulaceae bacterium]MDP7017125.1 sigma-70 family RNA polymerase sigma factor [Pirellulaceae bacterium]